MIGKKINQLATELAPVSTDLTIIGDPTTGVSKKITLAQLGAIFSGAVSFYDDLASFPATGDINVIYCAKDTKKLYLWSGSAYVEVFPSQALLDTYQLRSEKGVSNGYASLDVNGKVPIGQLPNSIMEYKGTWNAATNTPTLVNGMGDTGDVYICSNSGTVNFGDGDITFAVGDYVVYSGSIYQRSSGAVGTVTSVGLSVAGDAISVSNSPITTSGTLALAFAGTSSQYINGAGNLTTFPTLTGYVPYTGATANVDLGTFDLTADILTAATGSYTSSGGGNTLEISHTSGSGIALNITKGGNGEGLYINKTSGTGNAATIVGTLEATTLVKTGGTSSQFLKADGSVDSSTYLTTSAAATTYLPMVLSSTANSIEINGQFFDVASAANSYTSGRLIIAPTYGAIGYQNAGVFDGLKILTNGNAEFSNSGITRFFNQVRFDSTLTNGTYTYTLPGATGTLALTSDLTGGTVTSVGLSSATSGVTIGSTPITTSGTITLAIATASGSQQGLLSSTDWTTFNNKQSALTNPVTGTGTTNYLPKFTGTSTIGNSAVSDDGTTVTLVSRALSGTSATFSGDVSIVESGNALLRVHANTTSSPIADIELMRGTNSTWGADGYGDYRFRNSGGDLLIQYGDTGVTSTRMTLSSSGNLGLGVTPSASSYKNIQNGYAVMMGSSADAGAYWNANATYDSVWKYIINGASSRYEQGLGRHLWFTAPSGTAGNAISFTQAMTLNASGNLSIGNTNDTYKLDVSGSGRFSGTTCLLYLTNTTATTGKNWRFSSASNGNFFLTQESVVDALTIAHTTGAATFSNKVTLSNGNLEFGTSENVLKWTSGNGVIEWGSAGSLYLRPAGAASNSLVIASTGAATFTFDNNSSGVVYKRNVSGTIYELGSVKNSGSDIYYQGTGNVFINADSNSDSTGPDREVKLGNRGVAYMTLASTGAATFSSSVTATQFDVSSGNGMYNAGTNAVGFQTSGLARVYISSGGNVGIGTTSPSARLDVTYGAGTVIFGYHNTSNDNAVISLRHDRAAISGETGKMILFNAGATQVGSITSTPSATAYNTSSDYRLKTDLKDFSGLDLVSKIKAYDYEWKSDKSRSYGVIAHELQSVINYAVTGVKDGEQMQGVDYSKIVPVLIKAIQELNDKIK